MSKFVAPDTVRLNLSDGDWIEVRQRLTYRESLVLANSALDHVTTGEGKEAAGKIVVRMDQHGLKKLELYLVDWSLTDDRGRRVKVTRDAIGALLPSAAGEMHREIDAFLQVQESEEQGEGKALTPSETGS